jgi:hypothetical protein
VLNIWTISRAFEEVNCIDRSHDHALHFDRSLRMNRSLQLCRSMDELRIDERMNARVMMRAFSTF